MMQKTFDYLLPSGSLPDSYEYQQLLSVNSHNAIFKIVNHEDKKNYILKICSSSYYDKKIYQSIFSLHGHSLLLPLSHFKQNNNPFSIYPYCKTLSEQISTEGICFCEIQNMMLDVGDAILTLHSHHILHLDICPNNVFINADANFLLGDFSSSKIENNGLLGTFFSRCTQKKARTGTTSLFSPPKTAYKQESFWNDQYSFAILIFLFLNNGNSPSQATFSSLETVSSSFESTFLPFKKINIVLIDAMKPPSPREKVSFSDFFAELKTAFSLYEDSKEAEIYHFKIREQTHPLFFEKTQESEPVLPQKTSAKNLFTKYALYFFFSISSLLFIVSVYHFTNSKVSKTTTNSFIAAATTTPPSTQASTFSTDAPLSTQPSTPSTDVKYNSDSQTFLPYLDLSKKGYDCSLSLRTLKGFHDNLHILFACQNHFTNCTPFSNLISLQELYLNHNSISSLMGIESCMNLEVLVLSQNKLRDLSPLTTLCKLTTLDLSHNSHLTSIRSLSKLSNLKYLILTNTNCTKNEIQYLKHKLPQCTILF